MSKGRKKSVVKESVPRFRSEDEERDFWAEHDVAYQSLRKIFLAERVARERGRRAG